MSNSNEAREWWERCRKCALFHQEAKCPACSCKFSTGYSVPPYDAARFREALALSLQGKKA